MVSVSGRQLREFCHAQCLFVVWQCPRKNNLFFRQCREEFDFSFENGQRFHGFLVPEKFNIVTCLVFHAGIFQNLAWDDRSNCGVNRITEEQGMASMARSWNGKLVGFGIGLILILGGIANAQDCPTGDNDEGGSESSATSNSDAEDSFPANDISNSSQNSSLLNNDSEARSNELADSTSLPPDWPSQQTFGPGFWQSHNRSQNQSNANGAMNSVSMPNNQSQSGSVNSIAVRQGLVGTKMSAERIRKIQQSHAVRAYKYGLALERKGRRQSATKYYRRAVEVGQGTEAGNRAAAALNRLQPTRRDANATESSSRRR